jgi:hypothetical protein
MHADIRGISKSIHNLTQFDRIAGHETKMHTLSGKFVGDGSADTAIRARYQRNLVV